MSSDANVSFSVGAAAATDAATERLVIAHIPIKGGDPDDMSVSILSLTPTELAIESARLVERKASKLQRMRSFVASQPNGSDRQSTVPTAPIVTAAELQKSLQSVCNGWQHIPVDELRGYHLTGLPPQSCAASQLAEYQTQAQGIVDELLVDPEFTAMMQQVPLEARDEYYSAVSRSAGGMVPVFWLHDQMVKLCVRPELLNETHYRFEKRAIVYSVEHQWCEAARLFNGFCRTVLELQQQYRKA